MSKVWETKWCGILCLKLATRQECADCRTGVSVHVARGHAVISSVLIRARVHVPCHCAALGHYKGIRRPWPLVDSATQRTLQGGLCGVGRAQGTWGHSAAPTRLALAPASKTRDPLRQEGVQTAKARAPTRDRPATMLLPRLELSWASCLAQSSHPLVTEKPRAPSPARGHPGLTGFHSGALGGVHPCWLHRDPFPSSVSWDAP